MSILIGDFPAVSSTKSNQALKCISTQDLKDSGRVQITWFASHLAVSNTVEGVIGPTAITVGYVPTIGASFPYTVTAGKTLRLQSFYAAVFQFSGTAAVNNILLRIRVAKPGFTWGTNNATNATVAMLDTAQPSATNQTIGSASLIFQDGIEIPGGYQVGVTGLIGASVLTTTIDYMLAGYEY